jgi:hypothetical protein
MMAAPSAVQPTPLPPPPSPLEQRWPLLAGVLAMHLVASLAITFFLRVNDNEDVGLMLGVLFGQITLIAVGTAWAPAPFFVRLASGLVLTTFVALTLGALILRDSGEEESALMFGVVLFAQWLASQAPLWFARAAWGQRIVAPHQEPPGIPGRELQFGLAQLLMLTTLVAAIFGFARWLFSPQAVTNVGDWWEFAALIGLFTIFNTLGPAPTIWAVFARHPGVWLALAALYLTGVAMAEAFAFQAVLGGGSDLSIFAWINAALFFVVAATLLAFRACGFRLQER